MWEHLRGYLVAVAATTGMVLLRWLLGSWMGDLLPLVTLYGAVALAVWCGGHRPALLATALGFLACRYLFIEPRGALAIHKPHDYIGLVLYLFTCSLIIGFGEAVRLAQRRTEEGQEILRVTFASMAEAVITTDSEGRVTALNAVAESLTGWRQVEAVGQPLAAVFRIVNDLDRQSVEGPVRKVLAQGQFVELANDTILIARDGTGHPIDGSASPIRDARGVVRGVVLVFRDISQRRRAEESLRDSEQRLRLALEAGRMGIWEWRIGSNEVLWSPGLEAIHGLAPGTFPGTFEAYQRDIHPEDREGALRAISQAVERGADHRVEYRIVLPSGAVRWVEGRGKFFPAAPGTAARMIGVCMDVTDRKQAEAALQRAMQQLQIVTDSMSAPVTRCSRDLRYLWVSKPYADWIGRPAEEIVGRPIVEVLGEEAFQELLPHFRQVLSGEQVRYEQEVSFRGLGCRWINAVYTPTIGPEGVPDGWVAAVLDITERKKIEEELRAGEERFRQLAEAMPHIVWTADAAGKNDYISHHWSEYTGRPEADGLSDRWTESIHPDDLPALLDRRQQSLQQGTPYTTEYRLRARDGEYRWQLVRGVPVRDEQGKVVKWYGTSTDIDEQKRLAEALLEADRRKNEFLATLAHELRNPLAPLRNSLEVVRLSGDSPQTFQRVREIMERQVQQMTRLLDDLLDVSRIAHGKLVLRKERIELQAVVRGAVETSRPLIERGEHELAIALPAEPVYLDADPVRLAQVFSNVLNNAAKYTEHGGHIRLTGERQGNEVVVSVKDDGIGIAAEMLPRLFDIFSQAKPALERSQGGLGIGLSLVCGLVELHGGRIEARSAGPGQGSEFLVHLPVAATEPIQQAPPRSAGGEQPRPEKCRLLIVDDLRDSADSLAMMLKIMGHQVHTAYDGEEAVAAAARFRPDVVLLDIGMPKLNGYDACRRIREQPWGQAMFLIALTGWGQEEDRRRTQEAGFDQHMVKPVGPATLIQLLAEMRPARG